MHCDFKTLKLVLPHVIRARHPIMLRAPHGVGKSEFVKSFASKIPSILYPDDATRRSAYSQWSEGKDYVYPVVDRRGSQMADAGDLMGLPFMEGDVTAFKSMRWFDQVCKQPCILLLDEIDRAPQDVRQAIFQVNDSRQLGDAKLHPDTIVFTCINGGTEITQYQVGNMDPAETSRWTIFDVRPTVEDWLSYAKEAKIDDVIYDFIKEHPSHLEFNKEFEANKVYPSRRSWTRLNKALSGTNILEDFDKELAVVLYHLADGYVGQDTAIAFREFVNSYDRKITVEDIIVKGKHEKVKKLSLNETIALIDKFENHAFMKEELDDGKATNLAKFIMEINPELAMKAWETCAQLCPKNIIKLHQMEVDNKYFSEYIADLQGANLQASEA